MSPSVLRTKNNQRTVALRLGRLKPPRSACVQATATRTPSECTEYYKEYCIVRSVVLVIVSPSPSALASARLKISIGRVPDKPEVPIRLVPSASACSRWVSLAVL